MRVLPNAQVRKPGLRLALYTKILLWFLVNLGVVAAIGLFYARVTFQPGLDWLLNGPPGSRIELLAMHLTNELMTSPQPDWDRVLKGYHAEKEVTFTLFTSDGRQVFGEQVEVAAEVRKQLIDKRQPGVRLKPPRPQGVEGAMMQPKKPRFLLRSESPKRYWSGMHLDLMFEADGQWHPLTMVLIADTLVEEFPEGHYVNRPWDRGNNPMTAGRAFLEESSEFELDLDWSRRALLTEFRDGVLKKVR